MKRSTLQIGLNQYVCFGICLLLMLVIPITRDYKLIGIPLDNSEKENSVETLVANPDGSITVNTTELGKGITGYAGPTPVEITIKDDKIQKITPLSNQETPEFFGALRNSDLFESLDGKSLQEALNTKIDGISGATYSSNAVIDNIKMGIGYAADDSHKPTKAEISSQSLDAKWYATLVIILCGAILPFFIRNKKYRLIQLLLNVGILGFWGGTFVSYSIMVSALANGLWRVILIPIALMMIVAFIYPLFGKVNHYCNWICPYGSLQELAGKCLPWKISVAPKTANVLTVFRELLWFALMWLLWTGLWFDWMGYEPFAAFFFIDASWVVLAIAGAFLLLSLFFQRPYCRFVCPTGSLFKFTEGRR